MSKHVHSRVLIALVLIAALGAALVSIATPLVKDALSTRADAGAPPRSAAAEPETADDRAAARVPDVPPTEPDIASTAAVSEPPGDAPIQQRFVPTVPVAAEAPTGYVATEPALAKAPTAYVPPPSPSSVAALAPAEEDEAPPSRPAHGAAGAIDINSASAEELNRLGGGRVGKAIVKGRPYERVEELVSKKILTRSAFNQIKAKITAR